MAAREGAEAVGRTVAAAAPGRSAARRWGPGPGSVLRQGGRPRGQRPEPAGAGAEGPRSGVRDGRGSGGPHEDPEWSRAGACAPHSADTRGHQARRRAASGRPRPSIDVYQGPCSGAQGGAAPQSRRGVPQVGAGGPRKRPRAAARKKDGYLRAQFLRLKSRRGPKRPSSPSRLRYSLPPTTCSRTASITATSALTISTARTRRSSRNAWLRARTISASASSYERRDCRNISFQHD